MSPASPGDLSVLAAESIAQHLRDWGVEVMAQENVFAVATIPFPCTCEVIRHGDQLQLDVLVWIDQQAEVVIVESHAGIGADETVAVQDAVHNWLHGVYPVLASAFGLPEAQGSAPSVSPQPFAFAGDDDGGAGVWQLYAGSVLVRGDEGAYLAEGLQPFETIRDLLAALQVNGDVMWGRTFVGGIGDERTSECLMMNETWPEGEAALGGIPWPATEAYLSARQFFVAIRE